MELGFQFNILIWGDCYTLKWEQQSAFEYMSLGSRRKSGLEIFIWELSVNSWHLTSRDWMRWSKKEYLDTSEPNCQKPKRKFKRGKGKWLTMDKGILNKIDSWFLTVNCGGQKAVGGQIESDERKLSARIYLWQIYPSKLSEKLRHSQINKD